MLGRHSFRPYPETRLASRDRKRAVSAQHTPRQNHLLAALPLKDYERLPPDLEPVPLPLGWTVHGAGDREKYLYFLTAGIVSRCYVTENGASAAFAVTGSEGVIGVASFLGGESTPSQAVVLSADSTFPRTAGRGCPPPKHLCARPPSRSFASWPNFEVDGCACKAWWGRRGDTSCCCHQHEGFSPLAERWGQASSTCWDSHTTREDTDSTICDQSHFSRPHPTGLQLSAKDSGTEPA